MAAGPGRSPMLNQCTDVLVGRKHHLLPEPSLLCPGSFLKQCLQDCCAVSAHVTLCRGPTCLCCSWQWDLPWGLQRLACHYQKPNEVHNSCVSKEYSGMWYTALLEFPSTVLRKYMLTVSNKKIWNLKSKSFLSTTVKPEVHDSALVLL